jgi:DNA repair exonuclease SbcCD nuclease subunit
MSAIILSDLHSHAWPRFSTTLPDGTNSRFQDLLNVLAQVDEYADEYEVRDILILGDLTHRRGYVQFSIYSRICDWIAEHLYTGRRVIALVGNHDIESEGHHSLAPLRHMGVGVIEQPMWTQSDDGVPWLLVPYLQHDMVKGVSDAPKIHGARKPEETIAFMHYAFDGKILSNEFAVPSALKRSEMSDYAKVILGHIHTPSVDDNRTVYVGAPLHFDFGDSGDRFCWLLDRMTLKALPLRFPRFVTATYPRLPITPADMPGFLRVLGTPRQLFGDVKKEALASGWQDVLLVEQSMPVEAVKTLSAATLVNEDMIRDYVQTQYGELDKKTRGEIMALGLKYLREASE